MRLPLVLAALAIAGSAQAETPAPSTDQPLLRVIAADVDPKALESTIRSLVSFGTRHTMSDAKSDKRGIGAARRWTKARFEAISRIAAAA
jgi:Zn-dependent M28 family amino/carboxypeptidase